MLSNRLSIDQPINSTSTTHSAVFDFTGLLTLEDNRTGSIIAFLRFPWLLVTVSLAVSSFMHVDDPTLGKWLLPGRCRAVAALASPLSFRLVILFHPPLPPVSAPCAFGHATPLACGCDLLHVFFFYLFVCLFYYKMMLYWRSPGMGCTAPVDIYYLKAPPSPGKHKIKQNIDLFLSLFATLTSWNQHLRTPPCVIYQ